MVSETSTKCHVYIASLYISPPCSSCCHTRGTGNVTSEKYDESE